MGKDSAHICPPDMEMRAKVAYKEATVSVVGNVALFVAKLVLGLMVSSISLIADSFHSLSDVGTSIVVFFGFKGARKAADREHPFGHGRMENIATLIIATLLASVGVEFIYESISGFLEGPGIVINEYFWVVILAVAVSIVGKEAMARYSYRLGREITSDALRADAWHHRTDALTSIGVLLALIGSYIGYPILDPIFGVLVSVVIIFTGIRIIRGTVDVLVGRAPSPEVTGEIERCAVAVNGVAGVHGIIVHDYGFNRVVSLHIEVEENVGLKESHRIADAVERCIKDDLDMKATVHVDPAPCSGLDIAVGERISGILASERGVDSHHRLDVRIVEGRYEVEVHVIVDPAMTQEASHALEHRIIERVEAICPGCRMRIHLEPNTRKGDKGRPQA